MWSKMSLDGTLALFKHENSTNQWQFELSTFGSGVVSNNKGHSTNTTFFFNIPITRISISFVSMFKSLCSDGQSDWLHSGYEHAMFCACLSQSGCIRVFPGVQIPDVFLQIQIDLLEKFPTLL